MAADRQPLTPQQRLALSRRALVAQLQGDHREAASDALYALPAPAVRPAGFDHFAWSSVARGVVRRWWRRHPANAAGQLARPLLERYARGRAFIAIRDRDISAEVLGIPLLRYKLLSFGLSSFYAGVAGGLWAYFFRVVTPESFPLLMSIFFLAAIIVGGMGTILGGILGAVFMTMVPELLKLVFDLLPGGTEATVFLSPVRTVVFGLLIVGFLVFEPHGLAEVWRRIRRFFHLWPFKT